MKIGVIGGGTVGRATARCWLEFAEEVRVFDCRPERATHSIIETLACDLVFICVGLESIDDFFGSTIHRGRNFVIKSTVPVGTTRALSLKYGLTNLVHSPEFLTARCADVDARMPSRNIIGVPWRQDKCHDLLHDLYMNRFPGIQILTMSSEESEFVKLANNGFGAAKIAFFNELREMVDALGLDWERVLAGLLSDERVGGYWTKVPGPDGERGYGGRCLPKDVKMLLELQRSLHQAGKLSSYPTSLGMIAAARRWAREE